MGALYCAERGQRCADIRPNKKRRKKRERWRNGERPEGGRKVCQQVYLNQAFLDFRRDSRNLGENNRARARINGARSIGGRDAIASPIGRRVRRSWRPRDQQPSLLSFSLSLSYRSLRLAYCHSIRFSPQRREIATCAWCLFAAYMCVHTRYRLRLYRSLRGTVHGLTTIVDGDRLR